MFQGHFSRSLRKSDLKTCIAALNHEISCLTIDLWFDLFHLVTWADLDLYYGHKAQEIILTEVSDTIHADSLALFALNIEILLADVIKTEKSKILTLTWPVTSSVTSWSNFWLFTGRSRTGLSNGVWNLEIGPVVWEISGGPFAPPPSGRVTNQTPAGRGLILGRTGGGGIPPGSPGGSGDRRCHAGALMRAVTDSGDETGDGGRREVTGGDWGLPTTGDGR